ncbi:MAG: glycosyltransferase [Lentisphaerae bacterium]|nr:glycosyltransferase [Lentisphaerota bacterium]
MFEREENPHSVTEANIVVGVPSFMEADSIDYPTQQSSLGLKKYYPDRKGVIVNCDNASPDGTEQAFMGAATESPKIYITTPSNTHGKGYNFENMFRKVLELNAEMLVCVDADLTSITPEWIKYFVDPLLDGYDFVSPIYSRHKYDGTITNSLCMPLVYGLFCRNIRQPIGGDFAMSSRLARHLICQPWHQSTEEYGIDIFMTMNAIFGGFRMCETGLGTKIHKPSAPKLGPMFTQVVSTAFLTVIRSFPIWKEAAAIERSPLYGLRQKMSPQELEVDRTAIEKSARDGFVQMQGQIERSLSAELYCDLSRMFCGGAIDITPEQWCRIVYDMIEAFATSPDQHSVVEALKGLYFGRALSFMNKTWEWSTEQAEEEILSQADIFHAQRGGLIGKLEAI